MEKITTDISTFENLRKGGYVYVDKTDMLWRLVSDTEGRQFFISRPRRFGKSLMLSTLKCIFEGKRELFKGLRIEKKRYDWKKYPVVHLNMAEVVAPTVDKLRENLSSMVKGLIKGFRLKDVSTVSEPGMSFGSLGIQYFFRTERAFSALAEIEAEKESVDAAEWYGRYNRRDRDARSKMYDIIENDPRNDLSRTFKDVL